MTWQETSQRLCEGMVRLDIAQANLACAAGLPDAQDIDCDRCLDVLDEYAERVHWKTVRNFRQFERHPEKFYRSEAYFRALTLATTLQRDCGVRYNPAKIPEDTLLDTADTFIHGVLLGDGGTCVSLPVVYIAVGRRLGYPLRLVSSRTKKWTHYFVRWDENGGARFNFETTTSSGLAVGSDNSYRIDPYDVTPEFEAKGGYLRSQTPREEMASFLAARHDRWLDYECYRRAAEALAWSYALAPDVQLYRNTLEKTLNRWRRNIEGIRPKGFPRIHVAILERRFPAGFPVDIEQDMFGLEATENILNDPEHNAN